MSNPNRLTRRDFLKLSGVTALGLTAQAACARLVPAPGTPPTPGASPTPTNPNVLRPTPTTVPGETIQGETLAMGGAQLRLSSMSGAEIAKAVRGIGPEYKTLQVLVNDQGFSDSFIGFTGENQTQVALLAQGPKGFIWDSKKGIWNSPSGDLVFIPDVILPGSFDEIKNTAGPSALADHVFLAQNNLGYLQAGVIYPADVVAKLREKSVPIELLADGSGRGLFLGNQKIIPLEKGQSVERDTNGDLILKSADGSYKRMITSWGNVTGKEQLYQVGAFAGPIEAIPEVLYPGEKLTQEAIVPFANAFGVKPEEVGNLTPQLLTGVDGKQFVVLTTGDLAATTTFDESTTPLMIAEQGENGEWVWSEATLKNLAEEKGIQVGTEGSGWLLGNQNSLNLAHQEVEITIPTYPAINWKNLQPSKDSFDADGLRRIIQKWENNGFQVILPAILHVNPDDLPDWLINGNYSTAELEQLITNYVTQVVNVASGEGVSIGEITSEPYLPQYRTNDYFYNKFGNYGYIRTAVLAAKKAQPDFKLIYNDTDNHSSSGLTTSLTKRILQENPEIDYVGVEGHLGDWVPFYSAQDVETTLKSYGRPIIITEHDIDLHGLSGDLAQKRLKQAQVGYDFITAAKKAGVKIFVFWGLDGNVSWLENSLGQNDSYGTMFDENGQPTPYFYSVCAALFKD